MKRDIVVDLRSLEEEQIHTVHNPMTPRYFLGNVWRVSIIQMGICLGKRETEHPNIVEVAFWMEHPSGHKKSGFYACYKCVLDKNDKVFYATMFCFYDGTEKSKSIKTFFEARVYAKQNGFENEK